MLIKENSIEIAKSCNLINKYDRVLQFSQKTITSIEEFKLSISSVSKELNFSDFYTIIDGKAMSYFDSVDDECKSFFINILTQSSATLCCRLTPKQKANITSILKKKQQKIVLCIGDGANDAPMIMEASVGIGISGKEGTQVRSFIT